jgi:hypothetical protein
MGYHQSSNGANPASVLHLLSLVQPSVTPYILQRVIHSEQHTPWLPSSSSRANGNAGYANPIRRPLPPQADTSSANHANHGIPLLNSERVQASLRKSLSFLVHLTAKFPLVFIFLLIVLYAIPASAAVLLLYILITVLFALPSFLILYFAYPSLDWLVREIFA